jgi:uncharacterized protein
MPKPRDVTLRVHPSIDELAIYWPRLEGLDDHPSLRFEWLSALEASGAATADSGWLPHHLSLWSGEELLALAPAYLKGHSQGEFVFDHAWAGAAKRFGVDYYPKLLVAVPFTPTTGPRLLHVRGADPELARRSFAGALSTLVDKLELSSAHVNFLPEHEADTLREIGLTHRVGVQFHWQNRAYENFEGFLGAMPSKRRTQIRRERRGRIEQGLSIETLSGDALTPEVVDHAYTFYLATVDKFVWGRRYLNRAFFEQIASTMRESLEVVLARDERGVPVAGAFNLRGPRTLYGRYWGAKVELPFLHFEVCYYHSIERCIDEGLERFEPGAGGEHKLSRGFEPTRTHSVHLVRDRRFASAIAAYCAEESRAIDVELGRAPSREGARG